MKIAELIDLLSVFDPGLDIGTSDDMGCIEKIQGVGVVQGECRFARISVLRGWHEHDE